MKDFIENIHTAIIGTIDKGTLPGEATFGFGEAYIIGGADMNELIPRRGGGHNTQK